VLTRRRAALLLGASVLGRSLQAQTQTPTQTQTQTQAAGGARWLPWPKAQPTPELRLPDLDGKTWDLAQAQGAPVLLNFWATWCEPCRAEMKSFEALERQFTARKLKVVAVNFKEEREPVLRFRAAQALTLALVRDSYGEAARAWGVRIFPTTFVINPVGRVALRIEGEVDWANAATQKRLEGFL
jgi:thiol-disulfide isomerase/thioredoxin